jgi:hypothetical protein
MIQLIDVRHGGFTYAYLASFIVEVDILCVDDIQKDFEGDDEIGIDDGASLLTFIRGEAPRVDDAHLLYDSRFTRFSRAYGHHALVPNLLCVKQSSGDTYREAGF